MPLIKEQKAELVRHEAVVLDLGDLRRAAERLTSEAESRAKRIVADAKAEAERLTQGAAEAGRAEGLAQGRAEGIEQGRIEGRTEALAAAGEQIDALVAQWAQALERFDAERRRAILDARQSLLELAVAVGEKVARRVPTVDPTVVVDQVAEAVERMARPADAVVRINPQDRPLVAEALPALVERVDVLEHASIAQDESIAPGGCIVTFGRGRIDATLDTQLDRIVALLLPASTEATAPQGDAPARGEPADEEPHA